MTDIKLPPLPLIPLFMDDSCRDEIASIISARDIEVARVVLEAAAKVCDTTPPYPFRPSIEAAWAIRKLEISHD